MRSLQAPMASSWHQSECHSHIAAEQRSIKCWEHVCQALNAAHVVATQLQEQDLELVVGGYRFCSCV